MDPIEKQSVSIIKKGSQTMLQKDLHKSSTVGMLSYESQDQTNTREKLVNELEDVFNKLTVEQAVV